MQSDNDRLAVIMRIKAHSKAGNLQELKKIYIQNEENVDLGLAMKQASRAGHMDIVEWLVEKNIGCDKAQMTWFLMWTVEAEKFEMAEWLLENVGCSWDYSAMFAMVWYGKLKVVQWFISNGCPPWKEEQLIIYEGLNEETVELIKNLDLD